jgi:tetratricopeptide (TPR) repeat protein
MKRTATLLSAVVLLGCSKPATVEQDLPSFLSIEPSPLQAGQKFTIRYNPSDTAAPYKNPTQLIAGVFFQTLDTVATVSYRIPLVKGANGIWSLECTVPEKAYWCELWIAPPELPVYLLQEMRTPVFVGSIPQRAALPTQMDETEDSASIVELFQLDEQLYPDEYWRWASLWQWNIQHGPGIRQDQVDSLWRIGQNSISATAVCLYGFALSREWNKAAQAGQHLQKLLTAHPNAEIPWSLLRNLLSTTWAVLPAENKASDEVATALSTLWSRFPKELDASRRLSEDYVAPERFHQRGRHHYETILEGWVQRFLQAGPASGWEEEAGGALKAAINLVEWKADTARALMVLEKAVHLAQRLPDSAAPGCGIRVPLVSLPSDRVKWGWISSLYAQIGKLSLERSPTAAEQWLRRVLQLPPLDAGTIGPTVSACATLARLFLKRGQLDSALKYYAWVYQLSGERRAEALRKELSPFIPAQSAERFQKVELLVQRYPYPRAIQADIPVIATEQGELINPTQVPVPVLLLFSSRTCGLCKQWYPRLIKEIAAARLPSRIIIVTPDRSRLEGLPAGTTVTYAPLSFELHRAFQIRGFPTVVVLRGGRVEYQGSLSSQQHLQTIMSLLQ